MSSLDLSRGPILRKLMAFFLPIAAGTLLQQLYNAVDALVVGKFVGTGALAAVGGTPAIISNLVIGFCTSLASDAAVVIAQLHGARKDYEVTIAVKTSYVFCGILGIVVGAAVIAFSPQILELLETPADTIREANIYQRIYFSGTFFMLIFNMGAGILRAVGNSRFPFICLLVSCLSNIALDLLLVIGFDMGVTGVALATVIAQFISAVMVTARLLLSQETFGLRFRNVDWSFKIFGEMMRIGLPSGLQSSMYGAANTIIQIGVNSLGTTVVASWAMSGKIDGVFWAVASAFGLAVSTFIAQNYGAREFERIKTTAKRALLTFVLMSAVISTILLLSGRPVLRFVTDDTGVQAATWIIMIYIVPFYPVWAVTEVFSGVLRGIGDVVVPSVILVICVCVVRMAWLATAFRANPTLENLCLIYPISWSMAAVSIPLYYTRAKKKLLGKENP